MGRVKEILVGTFSKYFQNLGGYSSKLCPVSCGNDQRESQGKNSVTTNILNLSLFEILYLLGESLPWLFFFLSK